MMLWIYATEGTSPTPKDLVVNGMGLQQARLSTSLFLLVS